MFDELEERHSTTYGENGTSTVREREGERKREKQTETKRKTESATELVAAGGVCALCFESARSQINVCNLVPQRPNYYHTHRVTFAEGLVRRWEQEGSVSACGVRA